VALTNLEEMKKHARAIVKADPAFALIVKSSELCTINRKRPKRGHYETLVESIISQQLAVKAADTIFARVQNLASGSITPESIHTLSASDLRTVGVSGAKARAIGELTEATLSEAINFKKFSKLSNEEISAELTALWGIGRWTVEMFLIFHLGRLDLWPVGDLAVRRGWEKIHRLDYEIAPKVLDFEGEKFAGRQSIVAWYCWRAMEGDTSKW
jgi:DNA-3-methyladenine glycosylase II